MFCTLSTYDSADDLSSFFIWSFSYNSIRVGYSSGPDRWRVAAGGVVVLSVFLLSISRRLRMSAATASISSSQVLCFSTSSRTRELQAHRKNSKLLLTRIVIFMYILFFKMTESLTFVLFCYRQGILFYFKAALLQILTNNFYKLNCMKKEGNNVE